MRTLLVTSQVTFVPRNYDDLILKLANHPDICGLVIIRNRSLDILLKSLLLISSWAAPRLGFQLLKNFFIDSFSLRQRTFVNAGKVFLAVDNINAPETLQKLSALKLDLILNARTRSIFKKDLLALPRLGCLNIHHGILPDQRGLMCDLWAHFENQASGFSIHEMTPDLDAGRILVVQKVPTEGTRYLDSIQASAQWEAKTIGSLLSDIALNGPIEGRENNTTPLTKYRSNPGLRDFYLLQSKGLKI